MATESLEQAKSAPTYHELTNELAGAQEDLNMCGRFLRQMGDLFAAIRDSHDARVGNLCEIGHFLGSDWSNHVGTITAQLDGVIARAQHVIPKREWRTCGFPDIPKPDEIAAELRFAEVALDFPHAGDEAAALAAVRGASSSLAPDLEVGNGRKRVVGSRRSSRKHSRIKAGASR